MDEVTITISLPPKPLWQNSRVHWSKKSAVGGKHRREAWAQTAKALRSSRPLWVRAEIEFRFYWPDARRRDPLNAIGAMKWAVDGLVDAGLLLDDDKVTPRVPESAVDRERPRVEMTVRKA